MLVLTHGSPASNADKAFFSVVHGFGAGREHIGGVVVLGDGLREFGPVSGIAILPDGMAVLACHEVINNRGYLYAPTQGPWTVGGQIVSMRGGGSNPISELDSAVKTIVAKVRRGGVDPGYVQAVIAVDGDLSGVAQPETDRGSGVIVTSLDDRDVSDALTQATDHHAGGLKQRWTSADVLGVLSVLGYATDQIDTELLGSEGFPYSPYILRPTSLEDTPFSRAENPRTDQVRPLRSYDAAGARMGVSTEIDGQSTGPIAAVPAVPQSGSGDVDNPADLLVSEDAESADPKRSAARWLIPLALLLAVAAAIWFGGRGLFNPAEESAETTDGSDSAAPTTTSTPTAQTVGTLSFEPGGQESTNQCAQFAYGEIQTLLSQNPCENMDRALFLTTVEGVGVVVTLAEVTMPDAQSAAELKAKADTDGTGNVNDLIRDGAAPAGYPPPEVFENSDYASSVDGNVVRIVQAAFVDGSPPSDAVDAAADAALGLTLQ